MNAEKPGFNPEKDDQEKIGEKITNPDRNIEDFENLSEALETQSESLEVILEMDFSDEELKETPFNVFENLKGMIEEDFVMPDTWEQCSEELKQKIKEIAETLAKSRGAIVQNTPNGPELTVK